MSTTNLLLGLFGVQAVHIASTWIFNRLHLRGQSAIAKKVNSIETAVQLQLETKAAAVIAKKIGGN